MTPQPGPRLTVDPDGLLALRSALAMQRLSAGFGSGGAIVLRGLPRQRFTADAAAAGSAGHRPPVAAEGGGPRIPIPAKPVEPSDDQQVVLALVTRAQAGEAEAFGQLYDRYSQVVYRYIAYRCGSTTLAEDLTSETFLRALRRISSYSWQGRDFGAWLVTIARNLLADHYKSGRYRLEIATSDLVEAGADRAQEGPENDVLASLTNAALIEAVKQLGGEQQECIVLRFLQGMSVAETAMALGKNEGAIKALQYRAVKSLARLLPPELAG